MLGIVLYRSSHWEKWYKAHMEYKKCLKQRKKYTEIADRFHRAYLVCNELRCVGNNIIIVLHTGVKMHKEHTVVQERIKMKKQYIKIVDRPSHK